jgi:cyclomaltodextrinase / maltogenic alpha-amylase / neopullulanase
VPDDFYTPEWVHHAIFYEIFPDRFARSANFPKPGPVEDWESPPTFEGVKGGDLLGVIERLDYLQDLGVNALYFTPIFQAASNHGYNTHDYFRINPLLGSDEIFDRLIREAHQRGLHVVLDGVFNHASRGFFPFNHILENGQSSPYYHWFYIKSFPLKAYQPGDPNYEAWWNLPSLPKFNFENPHVRNYMLEVSRYWLERGIDGWRLDAPDQIDVHAFWEEFRQVSRQMNPEAYLVGEIAEDATDWLQGNRFDGVMNYLFAYGCWVFFSNPPFDPITAGGWGESAEKVPAHDAQSFAGHLKYLWTQHPRPAALAQMNLLGSHDTVRLRSIFKDDFARQRLAVLLQFTFPGAPMILYGDEIGLQGGSDPDNRRTFPWDESRWDHDLRAFYQSCIAMRQAHPALRTGEFSILHAEGDVLSFLRHNEHEKIIVIFNRGNSAYHANIDLRQYLPSDAHLSDLLSPGETWLQEGHLRDYVIQPVSAAVLSSNHLDSA